MISDGELPSVAASPNEAPSSSPAGGQDDAATAPPPHLPLRPSMRDVYLPADGQARKAHKPGDVEKGGSTVPLPPSESHRVTMGATHQTDETTAAKEEAPTSHEQEQKLKQHKKEIKRREDAED